MEQKTTPAWRRKQSRIYRQGSGWVLSTWSEEYQSWWISEEMTYQMARSLRARYIKGDIA